MKTTTQVRRSRAHTGKHPSPGADSPCRPGAARAACRRRAIWRTALAATLLLTACPRPEPPPPESPRLVLFLVVDQLRADYLERTRPLLSGGLARLLDEGVVFEEAHHVHANTSTAPGHATLATGLYPAHSGIVGNSWVDHETGEEVYCVEDSKYGSSPGNLLAPTLGDWIKERYPSAKVLTLSGKDRAAILTGGHHADGAFWYDRSTGEMTTSGYYELEAPPWLEEFNDRRLPEESFGHLWEPLPVTAEQAAAAGFEVLDEGVFQRSLPHPLGGFALTPDAWFFAGFYASPYLDEMLVAFAREVVASEGLGRDAVPDFLGISFSSLDAVGHPYGPHSPEVLDTLLRLDRALGELLDDLDREVGLDQVVISLSADHGVASLPEWGVLHGRPARRAGAAEVGCVQSAGREVAKRLGADPWLDEGGLFYLDREALGEDGLDAAEVEDLAASLLEECPLVAKVWTGHRLARPAGPSPSREEILYRNNYHPDRSPDLFVQLGRYDVGRLGRGTSHGSVWPEDTHVPLLLRVPGVGPRRVRERVATVDLAPTLADLLQVPKPADLDGTSRAAWLAAAPEEPSSAASMKDARRGEGKAPGPRGPGTEEVVQR